MRYVTIDGGGARLLARDPQSDRLENALTLAGCGSETAIDLSWSAMLSPAPEVTNSVFFVEGLTRYFPRVGEGDDPLSAGGFFDEGSHYRDPSCGNCFGVDPAVDLTTYTIVGALGTTCIPTEPQLVDDRLTPGNYLGALDPTGEDWLRWMR